MEEDAVGSMAALQALMAELHADDLPTGAHMLTWSVAAVRRYASEGGFWTPDVDAPKELPAADQYELFAVARDSTEGHRIAAFQTDEWAARAMAMQDAYEPQADVSWCGLASCRMALQALLPLHAAPSQHQLHQHWARSFQGGLSLTALQKICAAELAAAVGAAAVGHVQPQVTQVAGESHDALWARLLADLRQPCGAVLLANMLRLTHGHYTGHWSPLGGFAEVPADGAGGGAREPWVLLNDPAAHKLPSHWLPLRLLVGCLCTRNARGEPRGYLQLQLCASRAV